MDRVLPAAGGEGGEKEEEEEEVAGNWGIMRIGRVADPIVRIRIVKKSFPFLIV